MNCGKSAVQNDDLVTSRPWSLRSCQSSIIKGCCLCFSSFHHCSYIKLCGHSPLQHLRDRRCHSITTGTCQCQQFYARFCWGCHIIWSSNFVCAASIMCAQKMTKEWVERQFSSFLPSEFCQFRQFRLAWLQWENTDAHFSVCSYTHI